jgi:excisionase family DNA binding protein
VTTAIATRTDSTTNDERKAGMAKLLLTPEEAAGMLGIGRTKVYELIAGGQLRSVKIGRCRRITASALAEFVACLDREAA